jgi:hypothetical protein
MRRPLRPRDGRKTYSVSGPQGRSDCFRAGVFTKGWIGVQPQRKDRLQEASRQQTVTTASLEKTAWRALGTISKRQPRQRSPKTRLRRGIFKAGLRCPMVSKRKRPPATLGRQGPDAPLAHRRPGYPSSGCVPAEPASVSPDTYSLLCTGTIRGENHREIRCAGDTLTKKSPAGP